MENTGERLGNQGWESVAVGWGAFWDTPASMSNMARSECINSWRRPQLAAPPRGLTGQVAVSPIGPWTYHGAMLFILPDSVQAGHYAAILPDYTRSDSHIYIFTSSSFMMLTIRFVSVRDTQLRRPSLNTAKIVRSSLN